MLGGAFLAGSATVFGGLLGGATYKRRKKSGERLEELEADLEEVHEDVSLETGRKWLDRERFALSSKTLEATAEVQIDFSEYDDFEEVIEAEEDLQGIGSGLLQPMVEEYEPNDSPIDRYTVNFEGEEGIFSYSVTSEEFYDGFDEERNMELNSLEEVYSETFGEELYHELKN